MRSLLLAALLIGPTALAQETGEAKAEYDRVSLQLNKLAARNQWTGVERQYNQLVELGLPLSAQDYFNGAEAARNLGDTMAAQERLKASLAIESRDEIIDFLWEIDNAYNTVSLRVPPGTALNILEAPFQPTQAAAVQRAQGLIAESGTFEGLLPGGDYTLGDARFSVVPMGDAVTVDLIGEEVEKGRRSDAKPPIAAPLPLSDAGGASDPVPVVAEMPEATPQAEPEPKPEKSADNPTLLGVALGFGSPYGMAGIGAGVRFTAAQSLQLGVGFHKSGGAAGWSAALRQRIGAPGLLYAEVGYGAVEYRQASSPGAGPFLAGGIEVARAGLLVDGTFGVGTTTNLAGDRVFKPIAGVAVGMNFGPAR